jgi:hypothetical protein
MNSVVELVLELAGGVVLLFATGYTFARISGYGEFYDKMLYDEDGDIDALISGFEDDLDKMFKNDEGDTNQIINKNDDNIAHHFAI